MLKQLAPSLISATALVNPDNPMTPHRLAVIEEAGRTLLIKVPIRVTTASEAKALEASLQGMAQRKAEG
jgi:hypothetical protein